MFLPTLIASFIGIFVRIISTNAGIFQLWHALTHSCGSSGRDSLYFEPGGWRSVVRSVRSLSNGTVVPFLANFLLLLSAVLVPISAEAISLDLRGECRKGDNIVRNCAWVLSASAPASRVTIGLLVLMSVNVTLLLVLLGMWRLGVYANPRSICALASLSLNKEVRQLVALTKTPLEGDHNSLGKSQIFKLGHFQHVNGKREYGIMALGDLNSAQSTYAQRRDNRVDSEANELEEDKQSNRQRSTPFFILSYLGRLSLFLLVCGVLILVLYYSLTKGDTAFERFIDSDSFGVRFLFASFGVVISFFWSSFFDRVVIMTPYQLLANRPQNASRSILLAPPTNAFSGIWYAARTRHLFLGAVGLASVLSNFLGIFLSNVPFQVTQTYLVFQISTWTAIGILSFMILIIAVSFFIKWPYMPVDPSSIAGAMYYIHDSSMLDKFEGLGTLKKGERDRRVMGLCLSYELRKVKDDMGKVKMVIDALDTTGLVP
ncbi:hypothetical protein F5Y12DRAFT_768672 [Xylaria sp. FL1777]|nr:hypothetical protein F5Y12DRAFT_768672 [Xylaria sp. FL1777]